MSLMEHILIVDDDAIVQMALIRHLGSLGYEVHGVSSAEAGLRALNQTTPAIIISDVIMPGMDGLEFCQRVRSMPVGRLIPFIFLSCRGELDARIEGHNMGADDYLAKPFHFRELAAKVRSQLDRVQRVRHEMAQRVQQATSVAAIAPAPLPLTPSEEKVFFQVIQGYTNKQVGDRLFLSPRTVQTHLSRILSKLNLGNRSQLVRFAFEHGYRPQMTDKPSAAS
ncbi:MAG: response regulator transcription factor [Cyanobacteria bacterium P01_A01_bin.37]